MKKTIFIDLNIKNNNTNSGEYRADKKLSRKIVNDIAKNESFQAVMEVLSN